MSLSRAAAFAFATLAWFAAQSTLHAQLKGAPKQLWESKDATRFQRLALSPDGKVLAYTRHEFGPEQFKTHVRLCEARTGKELHQLAFAGKNKGEMPVDPKNPNRPPVPGGAMMVQMMSLELVTALAFSPDSKTLTTLSNGFGTNEVALKLWDVASGKLQKSFPLSMMAGQGLAYLPDGRVLAGGMSTKMTPYLKILETKQGKAVGDLLPDLQAKLNKYYPKQAMLTNFDLAPDGKSLVVGIGDFQTSFVHVYDLKTQKLDFNIAQLSNNRLFSAATLSPDGKTVAVARQPNMMGGFGVFGGQGIGKIEAQPPKKPDEAPGTTIDLIDRSTKKKRATINLGDAEDNNVGMLGDVPFRFTADSRFVVAGGNNAGKVRMYDAQTGEAAGEHATGLKRVTALAMGPNMLVTGSDAMQAAIGQFGGVGFVGGGQPPMPPGGNPPPGLDPAKPRPAGNPFQLPPGLIPPGFQPQGFPPPEGKPGVAPMPPAGGIGGIGGGFQPGNGGGVQPGIGGGFGFAMPAAETAIKVWEWTTPSMATPSSSSQSSSSSKSKN